MYNKIYLQRCNSFTFFFYLFPFKNFSPPLSLSLEILKKTGILEGRKYKMQVTGSRFNLIDLVAEFQNRAAGLLNAILFVIHAALLLVLRFVTLAFEISK